MKVEELYEEREVQESFRDHLSTVDELGKRVWVYPKKPSGTFTNLRAVVAVVLLLLLLGMPFIKIGGEPLFLFDVLNRKFVLFGQVFWPQDFFLAVVAMITLVVFIILFTVVFGRIFCGWVCPQTIFMEWVFRRVEYLIEGDYTKQRKLDKQPWNAEKIWKKGLKHFIFLAISVIIMHTFLAYLIGVGEVHALIMAGPGAKPLGFLAMIVMTLLFYGVFSTLREQVCTTICPYGRLQGVLLDRESIVVAYDHVRGEERGKFRKGEDREAADKGDCIDCKQCVYVCPTGIDIRNGTQLECVNCTACIDACNDIMEKVNLPKGLIRYASEKNIAEKRPFQFTGRMTAYSAVLGLLLIALTSLMMMRTDLDTTILRTPGMTYQVRDDGAIANLYQYKLVNKTSDEIDVSFKLESPEGKLEMVNSISTVGAQALSEGAFFVVIKPENTSGMSNEVVIGVYKGETLEETLETKFISPL